MALLDKFGGTVTFARNRRSGAPLNNSGSGESSGCASQLSPFPSARRPATKRARTGDASRRQRGARWSAATDTAESAQLWSGEVDEETGETKVSLAPIARQGGTPRAASALSERSADGAPRDWRGTRRSPKSRIEVIAHALREGLTVLPLSDEVSAEEVVIRAPRPRPRRGNNKPAERRTVPPDDYSPAVLGKMLVTGRIRALRRRACRPYQTNSGSRTRSRCSPSSRPPTETPRPDHPARRASPRRPAAPATLARRR